jgi:hypothetical protein
MHRFSLKLLPCFVDKSTIFVNKSTKVTCELISHTLLCDTDSDVSRACHSLWLPRFGWRNHSSIEDGDVRGEPGHESVLSLVFWSFAQEWVRSVSVFCRQRSDWISVLANFVVFSVIFRCIHLVKWLIEKAKRVLWRMFQSILLHQRAYLSFYQGLIDEVVHSMVNWG